MTGSVSEYEREGDTLAPPPESQPTSPHHEIPERMSGSEELRAILGQVLDEKLEPLLRLSGEIERLRTSLDLAVHEFRRKTEAHDGELDALRARVRVLEAETVEHRGKLRELERDLDRLLEDHR